MPIFKQEEYKGYIVQAGGDIWGVRWYKILIDKPKWISLRSMTGYITEDDALSKAKKYIDEYHIQLHDKLVRVLRKKGIELI